VDHVGIYIGNAEFVHASRSGQPVQIESLDNTWWRRRVAVLRRMGTD
jgi:cell wall-associated NlpC family hydrolase